MTLIELFDLDSPIDNIMSVLTFDVDKVIFVGSSRKKMTRMMERMNSILCGRGLSVQLDCCQHETNEIYETSELLLQLATQEQDCVFDLTGGEDTALIAAGVVQERTQRQIPMYRISPNSGKPTAIYGNLPERRTENAGELTVKELITLFGGSVVMREEHPDGTIDWEIDEEFARTVSQLWEINQRDPEKWNKAITPFALMRENNQSDEPFVLQIKTDDFEQILQKNTKKKHFALSDVSKELIAEGWMELSCDKHQICVSFPNGLVFECLTKAGTIWELYLHLLAFQMKDSSGEPYFHDVMTGVFIDWDGIVHHGKYEIDTQNEIDIIAMRRMCPVFLSAKNGWYEAGELYKLKTVSARFGGKYVRSALFSSRRQTSKHMEHLRERANDMNIPIFEGNKEADIIRHMRSLAP